MIKKILVFIVIILLLSHGFGVVEGTGLSPRRAFALRPRSYVDRSVVPQERSYEDLMQERYVSHAVYYLENKLPMVMGDLTHAGWSDDASVTCAVIGLAAYLRDMVDERFRHEILQTLLDDGSLPELEEFDVNFILNLIDIGNIPGQVEMVLQRLHGERPAYELADLTRCVEQVLRIHRLTAQARKEKREALLEWCRKNKKENLQIVQAEIFVDPRARDDLFHIIRRSEMGISVNTNAFWADSIEHVRAMGDALRAAAEENTSFDKKQRSYLVNLDITLSPYHQEVVVRNGALRERVDVRNIARVCSVFGSEYPMIRVWVHRTDGPGVNLLTEEFQVEMERMGYYIVYYKGRGPRVCSIRKKGESALFKNIELDMNKPPPVEGEGYSELLEPFEYEGSSISGTDTVDGTNRRNYFEQPTLTAEGGFSAGEDRYGQYWMVDNLRYRSAGEIMEFSARDPLQRAIIDDRAHLFLLAEEVEPGLSEKLSRVQGSYALTRLLENAPMRLYLTQRLIQEETGKRRFRGPVIRADIGIGADIGALQHEYEMNKRRNGQTYDDVLAGGLAIPEGPVAPSLSVREHRAVTENI